MSLAAGLPPLVQRPQGHGERSTTHCPPIPFPQAPSGIPEAACNRFCCAVASITSTGLPANCSANRPSPAGLMPDISDDTAIVVTDWHFAGREYPPSLPLAGGAA